MRIKFWGVRGSSPTPERRNSRYGGNTACVEVRLKNGTLFIFDCGTGLRSLGKSLLREYGERPIHAYIFVTHFHWDHIQGIPFFQPFYKAGNIFLFHSVAREGANLQTAIEDQMANPYFPVDMSAMASARDFFELDGSPINVGGAVVTSVPLNHPQGCVAYRVEADGGVFVFATDTEPGSRSHDRALRQFVKGADVLVYDAQFTPEQLVGEKKGWGHSSWLEGTKIALASGVKQLLLFHHDPDSDDVFVDGLVEKAQQEFPEVSGAAEGMEILLPSREILGEQVKPPERRRSRRYQIELPIKVRWTEPDGSQHQVQARSTDISATGMHFVAPSHIPTNQPLELDVVLPDEITHRGNMSFRYIAQPVRREQANYDLHKPGSGLGLATTLSLPEEAPEDDTRTASKAKRKRRSRRSRVHV
jgi:phosphoribosyl 1,2-cyclic phosphodiesterase